MGRPKTAIVAVTSDAPTLARANKDSDHAAGASLSRRNPAVINAISAQLALGLTHQQIADALGLERSTVTKIIGDYMPTMDVARKRLEGAALGASEAWIRASRRAAKDGNHKPAKELLQAVGVVQQDAASNVNQFAVFVGDGQTAIGPAPTFAPEVVGEVVSCNTPSLTAERVSG